jgi:hypothetical protein
MNGGPGGSGLAQAQADLVRVRDQSYPMRRFSRADLVLGVLAFMPLMGLAVAGWLLH